MGILNIVPYLGNLYLKSSFFPLWLILCGLPELYSPEPDVGMKIAWRWKLPGDVLRPPYGMAKCQETLTSHVLSAHGQQKGGVLEMTLYRRAQQHKVRLKGIFYFETYWVI